MTQALLDLITAAFMLLGGCFALIGSIGLARLPDIFTRLHGPTKATTLGVGGVLLASILYFSTRQGLSLHELLVSLFLFLTAPVSALSAVAEPEPLVAVTTTRRVLPWSPETTW